MRGLLASAIILAVLGTAQPYDQPDPFTEMTFFRLLLYNDSPEEWNLRTRDAFSRNATYTVERGTCSNTTGIPYKGPAGGTEGLNLNGVNAKGEVFAAGCGLIYVGEPTYYEGTYNRTWVGGKTLSLSIGAGCTSRPVNGTWDNLCPSEPGGGRHKEYLVPVNETTTVKVDGGVCFSDTVIHGQGGYPEAVDSVRMLQANCTVNGTHARVELEHTCTGHVLLDSAYSIMGFKVDCNEYAIEQVVYGRCIDSACAGAKGDKARKCHNICAQIGRHEARYGCQPRESGPVDCPTPPGGPYGSPDDGTSTPAPISLPKFTDYCALYCDEYWDQSNTCMNNRVSVAAGEEYRCADLREYVLDMDANVSCNGSYYDEVGRLRGYVDVKVVPDTAAAFVLADIPYRFTAFYPRHALYRMENGSGPPYKEYRLADEDYRFNESHNDTSYYDFTYPETVENRNPPTIGENAVIDGFSGGNGSWRLGFTLPGPTLPEDMTLTVLSVGDRIGEGGGMPCDFETPCAGGRACLDERCIDPEEYGDRTVRLSECLRHAAQTAIAINSPKNVDAYGNATVSAKLESGNTTLQGRIVTLSCSTGMKENSTTDSNGEAAYTVSAQANNVRCTARYEGEYGYAPSYAMTQIRAEQAAFDPQPAIMFAGLIAVFAAVFAAAEGRRTLYDILETGRGFFR